VRRRTRAAHTAYPASRRAFDVCLTLVLLPAALTIGLMVAIAVLIDSPGPPFYRSWRVGRDGRPFRMLKFRTMRHRAEGPAISARYDERLTPLGRLLASTRLDELPQLWNVLKGDMRLVGPRPELEEFVRDHEASYAQILSIPPGLTGPTQLAYADEGALLASAADRELTYRSQILPAKVQLDLAYVRSNSLLGDLSVIVRTCLLPAAKLGYRLQGAGSWRDPRMAGVLAIVASMAVAALFGLFAFEAGREL
jgi:lipopolysaccharide/colanic/teichoic acid biosynthesis glycosyltransferase